MPNKIKDDMEHFFCSKPFDFLSVRTDGNAWVCCEDWLPVSIGNLSGGLTLEEVWNSDTAKSIRKSILDGSYKYCKENRCPFLVAKTLPEISKEKVNHLMKYTSPVKSVRAPLPEKISLTYDPTCNLKCPSCRSDYIVLKKSGRSKAQDIQDKIFTSTSSKDLKQIILTGYGDPFSSSVLRSFLKNIVPEEFPSLRINLMTNGLLLTPRMWESISSSHSLIKNIHVSIDACSHETYLQNRGGDFSKLLENLEFIGSLRKKNTLARFEISFVVQENNFTEMPDFVRLGRRLKCDEVLFQKIFNWGTYEDTDFKKHAIHKSTHERHNDLVRVLNSEILADSIVNLSNLTDLKTSTNFTL
ncbi:4Fe-4S cluster-binding domain-containing protein [Fulvivirga sp. 29W222]|uniref:4Fe-4S cluster-binding domain-containing protein n=1 Tax=Fulvivirga marina TaxID=2494733 RepID=A0A937FWF9_9BACT|nr:radical SAM protein [Fulvivirga marina]MBL6445763.1 4Fe-4S cluster-binding domain-containing protein [Fulvivirga marina]